MASLGAEQSGAEPVQTVIASGPQGSAEIFMYGTRNGQIASAKMPRNDG